MGDLSIRTVSLADHSTLTGPSPLRPSTEIRFQAHSLSPNPIGIEQTLAT